MPLLRRRKTPGHLKVGKKRLATHPNSEHNQQKLFFARISWVNHPAVVMTWAVPNQAVALLSEGARRYYIDEGCRGGVLDITCAYPSPVTGRCLFMEGKRPGEKPTDKQHLMIRNLAAVGHTTGIWYTAEEAFALWCQHLGLDIPWTR